MASLTSPLPPTLTHCQTFCAQDPTLGSVLVFISLPPPTASFSRMEAHFLSAAGFQSYPRLTLDPTSPLYTAVAHLPLQKQNSEVCRGIAVGLLKYFGEIPRAVKEAVVRMHFGDPAAGGAFDDRHAGELASRMGRVELSESIWRNLMVFLGERWLSYVDVDVVLKNVVVDEPNKIPALYQRGLSLLGEESFLPTTRLKRTHSNKQSGTGKRPDPRTLDYRQDVLRQIGEFVDTEINYVGKLQEFVEVHIAPLKERSMDQMLAWPKLEELRLLFPECLERIVEANSRFCHGLEDATAGGIGSFGAYVKAYVPTFKQPYEEYINASTDFPKVLAKLMGNRTSLFAKCIEEIGEQKLRSLLIEPVQRLPRYSLYIDNILGMLPEEHPATQRLIDAKECITEICSLQSSSNSERNRVVERLQALIPSWPARVRPTGRLITAVDCIEILPPFHEHSGESLSSMLLLFPDCLVILRRPKSSSPVARAVQAEVDKPAGNGPVPVSRPNTSSGSELQFAGWVDNSEIRLSEADDGTTLWITTLHDLRDIWDIKNGVAGMRRMKLQNAYEGRAGKLVEDFVKGKLERRVKDLLAVREIKLDPSTDLGFWLGVWGDENKWRKFAPKPGIVIFMADESAARPLRDKLAGEVNAGVEIACLIEVRKNRNRLDIRSFNEYSSSDTVSDEELLPVLTKRLATLQYRHTLPSHPPLTWAFISGYRRFLKNIGIPFEGESRIGKILRPASPVKLLSAFLGNSSGSTSPTKNKTLDLNNNLMLPPTGSPVRGNSRRLVRQESATTDDEAKVSLVGKGEDPMSELRKLEKIFECYVEALGSIADPEEFSRAGFSGIEWNVVDALHGEMLQSPSVDKTKSQPAGVIFAAFLRFVRNEWKDKMGVLISRKGMDEIQEKSDEMYLQDFEQYLRGFLLELTPQNRRAFRSIVKLLATVIQRVENAADKGSLVANFTELLLEEDLNALDYMPLIDRLVEDVDALFSDIPLTAFTGDATSMNGNEKSSSMSRRLKSNSISNSVNSNTSLRKRFGFSTIGSTKGKSTIAPESKEKDYSSATLTAADNPSKASSIWRTLSKSKSQETKKSIISRSKSTDYDARVVTQKRPGSRDRGGVRALFDNPPQLAPPATSSGGRPLSTIIYEELYKPPASAPGGNGRRKKRRSSLSDLISAREQAEAQRLQGEENGLRSFKPSYPLDLRDLERKEEPVPQTPPPLRERESGNTMKTPSQLQTPRSQIPKFSPGGESTPRDSTRDSYRPSHTRNRSEVPKYSSEKRENLPSMLPRRPSTQSGIAGLGRSPVPGSAGAPQVQPKLRVANLKSLREQSLELNKKASDTENSLQAELEKIGKEIGLGPNSNGTGRKRSGTLSSRPLPTLGRSNTTQSAIPSPSRLLTASPGTPDLATRLAAIEQNYSSQLTQLKSQIATLEASYSEIVSQKDKELRDIKGMLEDSQAENQVLYERFNRELGRVVDEVRRGGGEEIVGGVHQGEADRLRREVGRLRRENVVLKSRMGM